MVSQFGWAAERASGWLEMDPEQFRPFLPISIPKQAALVRLESAINEGAARNGSNPRPNVRNAGYDTIDIERIRQAIENAEKTNFCPPDVTQARELLAELQAEMDRNLRASL